MSLFCICIAPFTLNLKEFHRTHGKQGARQIPLDNPKKKKIIVCTLESLKQNLMPSFRFKFNANHLMPKLNANHPQGILIVPVKSKLNLFTLLAHITSLVVNN